MFFINRSLNILFQFVVDCPLSVLRLSMIVASHRWDRVRMECNFKKVRLAVSKFSRFRFKNSLEQVMELFLSRIQLIPFLSMSVENYFVTK